MKLLYTTIILCLSCLLFNSCIDEIDLNIDNDTQYVVVDGYISNRLDEYTIRLATSAIIGVGNDNIFEDISGAQVEVIDQNGVNIPFTESRDNPGSYLGTMQVDPDLAYEVYIQLADGEVIRSRPAKALPAPNIDSLTYEVVTVREINSAGNPVTNDYIDVFVNTSVNDTEKPFLRWRAQGIYEFKELYPMALNPRRCYVTNNIDLNTLQIFSTDELNGNVLRDEFVVRTSLDLRFNSLYCFHVDQFSISEEEYNYWTNVQKLVELEGALFDPPPGELKNNLISETNPDKIILGYFSVSSSSQERLFIGPSEIGYTILTDCTSLSFRRNPEICADCTLINGSTLEKPFYWPF